MRMKLFRTGLLFDVALVLVVLYLMYALLHQRSSSSSASSSFFMATMKPIRDTLNLELLNDKGQPVHAAADTSQLIDSRIRLLSDVRSKQCRRHIYPLKEKATVVIDFNDYQFYDLKNTILSILNQNYESLIEEILVVDDGSTLDYIRQDAERYLKTVPRARMLRQATQVGTTKARILAMKEMKTDMVIFLEPNVICSHGWLEPLMDLLVKNHEIIAVPHHDRIHNPVSLEYQETPDSLVAAPTWNFAIRMRDVKVALSSSTEAKKFRFYYDSPAIRGNAFAVRKSFLDSIGSLDISYEDSGAEILELSLRTWMCGGSIATVACSRVGVLNLHDSVKSNSERDCRRTAGLWYGGRKEVALRLAGVNNSPHLTEEAEILHRLEDVKAKRECRDIDWYLRNVANEIVLPSPDAARFGTIAVMSGRCGRVADDHKVELIDCNEVHANSRNANVLFEMTTTGQFKSMGMCLTTEQTAYITLYNCRPDDKQQTWTFMKNQLKNVWSDYCATHVTDPNRNKINRQIMMAQRCHIPEPDHKAFNQWQFQMV